jgi:hypothetical protein
MTLVCTCIPRLSLNWNDASARQRNGDEVVLGSLRRFEFDQP